MKHRLLDYISKRQIRKHNDFKVGDKVVVHFKESFNDVKKKFDGYVICFRGEGSNKTFVVRKKFDNIGCERIFSLHSPLIEKIDVVSSKKVRRAKLYYARNINSSSAI